MKLDQAMRQTIERSVLCWLASVDAEGNPNVSPKEVFCDFEDELLVAHVASPGTARNLSTRPQVCVSMVDVFVQKGYKFRGTATVLKRNHPDFEPRHDRLAALAGPDFPIAAVIQIELTAVEPILAPRYRLFPDTTEAQQVASAMETYGVRPA